MPKECLHDGHRSRLRRRFLEFGADSFCEHELLELALYFSIPRVNTNETAHRVFEKHKDFYTLFKASRRELVNIKGIGGSSADFLLFLSDMCGEYGYFQSEPQSASTDSDLMEYFREYFTEAVQGLCLVLCLDEKMNVVNKLSFTQDTITENRFEEKRTASLLLKSGCHSLILGINRPDKLPIPDINDFTAVNLFAEKYRSIGITLSDCIICSRDKTFSMKENGAYSFD